jgi:c-di-GMP phosphodiesterase
MERVLLSRQPIYQKDLTLLGYELLFRDDDAERASFRDGDEATAQVVVNTLMELGLEEMVEERLAFINVSRNFVLSDFCESLPPDRVVLELLKPPEVDTVFLKRLGQLRSMGYRFAVDEFALAPKWAPLLEKAFLVKFDVMKGDWNRIRRGLSVIEDFPVKLVAERVESKDQFDFCQKSGFDYFQGYFFCRPEVIRSARLPSNRLMTLRLIAKLNNPDLTINELEEGIREDLSLSYKLLRYVGSAACAVRGQIQSIRHAAVLMGIDRLRIWASLILFSGIEENVQDLTATAVIRARMCEELAAQLKLPQADRFFLVGLFSMLDTMLNRPLPDVLKSLQLAPDIVAGIVHHEGDFGAVLKCVLAYERRDWDGVHCKNLDQETVRNAYVKAMAWAIRSLNGFSDAARTEPSYSRK